MWVWRGCALAAPGTLRRVGVLASCSKLLRYRRYRYLVDLVISRDLPTYEYSSRSTAAVLKFSTVYLLF